jgi:hypothetical protein
MRVAAAAVVGGGGGKLCEASKLPPSLTWKVNNTAPGRKAAALGARSAANWNVTSTDVSPTKL